MKDTSNLPDVLGSLPSAEGVAAGGLRDHYLGRLRRLIEIRDRHDDDLNPEGSWLLRQSIFATYCDCVEAGARAEARELLGESAPPDSPKRNGKRRALRR